MRPSTRLLAEIGRLATPAESSPVVHGKAKDFFREVCRVLPWAVRNYKLDELTTVGDLRRNVAEMFAKHAGVTSPGVVDILIYKGREELEIADYIVQPRKIKADQSKRKLSALSPFMNDFFQNKSAYL